MRSLLRISISQTNPTTFVGLCNIDVGCGIGTRLEEMDGGDGHAFAV